MATNYKEKYFEEKFRTIEASFERVFKAIESNTSLTREVSQKQDYTNGKVNNLRKDSKQHTDDIESLKNAVFPTDIKPKDLPSEFWGDPKVKQAVLLFSITLLIFIALVAWMAGFDLDRIPGL